MEPVFTSDEVRRLERSHPDGLSSASVLELLRQRGVLLAEATFRKYVQLGLLPRSRRVGRKGKHRGSHGLYPVACVGRVAEIRQLMDSGLTLEEIQRSAIAFENEVETVRRTAEAVLTKLDAEVGSRTPVSTAAARKLQLLRQQVEVLADGLLLAAREICPPQSAARENEDPAAVAREVERELRGRRPARQAAASRVGKKSPGARPGQSR